MNKSHTFLIEIVRDEIGSFDVEVHAYYKETSEPDVNFYSTELLELDLGRCLGPSRQPLSVTLTNEESRYALARAETLFERHF
jgi:hypothetical protein